ncbi:alpha/beta fold hydrolase [Georgenia sp. SUBG003]|uniref:alpha/beta fold hydrolase n=1 Tax=Georgenia sp. SUBG003 TaxID=1497974 RepID=UPI0004D82CE1|nr:alpha/beta hydrolase [Georgenia sp. SUBG003]
MTRIGDIWVEHHGEGPAVLLLGGLGDTVESWQLQLDALADRYHLIAPDNRGAGRSGPLDDGMTMATMADDAAEVLRALDVPAAHVAGFSGGSLVAQELAIRHPDVVRSLVLLSTWARADAYLRAVFGSWRLFVAGAPDERTFLEAFYVWVYTPRAHADGTVARFVEEVMAFPHKQSDEQFLRQLHALVTFDSTDRLAAISAPTLVLAGGSDIMVRADHGRAVAEAIPAASFELLPGEAHQPFQEVPDLFNARVDAFWRGVPDSSPT